MQSVDSNPIVIKPKSERRYLSGALERPIAKLLAVTTRTGGFRKPAAIRPLFTSYALPFRPKELPMSSP